MILMPQQSDKECIPSNQVTKNQESNIERKKERKKERIFIFFLKHYRHMA
jgi:hypothetical protein